jgi:transcriptional regulator with XRE-family HTH domain
VQRVLSTLAREIPHENTGHAESTCNSLHVGNVLPKAQRGPLGLWLYESREEKLGLTREQVAAAIGINAATVTRAERPKGVAPDTRALIARFYQREAAKRGIEIGEPPLPREGDPVVSNDQAALIAALQAQTAAISELVVVLKQQGERRDADIAAALPTIAAWVEQGQADRGPQRPGSDPDPQPARRRRRAPAG